MSRQLLQLATAALTLVFLILRSDAEPDKQLAEFNAQIAQHPSDPQGYAFRGLYWAYRDFDSSKRDLERAAALHSNNPLVYIFLGHQRLERKEFAGAIQEFDQAVQLDPKNQAAYLGRANAKLLNKDYAGATADYTRVLRDFGGGGVYYRRGLAEEGAGDIKAAIKDLRRAAEFNIVESSHDRTVYQDPPAYYELQVLKHPNDPKAYFQRGCLRAEVDEPVDLTSLLYLGPDPGQSLEFAQEDFDKAIALDPQYGDAYFERARVKLRRGIIADAISDLDRAIVLEPRNENALEERGIGKLFAGNTTSALGDFQRSTELNPHFSDGCFFLGVAYECRGEFAAARDAYLKRLWWDRTDSDYTRIHLALVLRRLHQDESQAGLLELVTGSPLSWTRTVEVFLLGQCDEPTFFKLARAGPPDQIRRKECEAAYYAGMLRLFKGETGNAKVYFRASTNIETQEYVIEEYFLAKAELARLR